MAVAISIYIHFYTNNHGKVYFGREEARQDADCYMRGAAVNVRQGNRRRYNTNRPSVSAGSASAVR
jgi:hypothetical protein